MRLREIIETFDNNKDDDDTDLPFDVVEDVVAFLRNDSNIYRRVIFPAMAKGKTLDGFKKILKPKMKSLMLKYMEKYDVPPKALDIADYDAILTKTYQEEIEE